MENLLEFEIPERQIYNYRKFLVGTFIGGPIAAGYFIAENFKAYNETKKARNAWIYTIIATVIIFGVVFLLPDS